MSGLAINCEPYLKVEEIDVISSTRVSNFYDYWRSRMHGVAPPAWSDIDLMEIYRLAPFITVKDVIGGGRDFRNRYWGTGLTDAYDFDATGLKFSGYLEPDARDEEIALHHAVVEMGEPKKSSGTLSFWHSKSYIRFEGVICPLTGAGGGVDFLIACYEFTLEGH